MAASAVLRAAIICNPESGRVRRAPNMVRDWAATLAHCSYHEVRDGGGIQTVVERMLTEQPGLIIVAGGDGTLHGVLTVLLRGMVAGPLPAVCPLSAGTTNMTARDLGMRGGLRRQLRSLRACLDSRDLPSTVRRPVLCVDEGGDSRYGMFFGAGIIAAGVRYFRERIRPTGLVGESASAPVIARYLWRILTAPAASAPDYGIRHVGEDGRPPTEGDCMLLLATVLDRLLLGLTPYWGEGGGPIHYTGVRCAPDGLLLNAPRVCLGLGNRLRDAAGYRSADVHNLEIMMKGEFIIDGETYSTGGERPLCISAGRTADFLLPQLCTGRRDGRIAQ